ncbi:4-hydroxybenzoate octaprenyltransferase [Verrucomicrobia bacterium LW23]|nr:4-hydroxybenzoate octaprenyltransferase [Verrucomicrobia bacterium LW23]
MNTAAPLHPPAGADAPLPPRSVAGRIHDTLEFVKFSHTIFALPFALIAMLLAANGLPHWTVIALILACMVSARTAAMAFNRWADWQFDIANPRTAGRSRLATRGTALALWVGCAALFVAASFALNPLCGWLSPVALALVLGYSLTKRFTAYCHAFLGFALAAAPMGAWAAVRGDLLDLVPWTLALAVLVWVFGFDIIYATQDVDYDRGAGLFSFPARYGIANALILARTLHVLALLALAMFGWVAGLGPAWWAALLVVLGALWYEHRLTHEAVAGDSSSTRGTKNATTIPPEGAAPAAAVDIGKINLAFFNINAFVSTTLLVGVILHLFAWLPLWTN